MGRLVHPERRANPSPFDRERTLDGRGLAILLRTRRLATVGFGSSAGHLALSSRIGLTASEKTLKFSLFRIDGVTSVRSGEETMVRLVLVLILLVLAYFLLRSAIREFRGLKGPTPPTTSKNDMVQDPVCGMYVPRGSAVTASIGGQTYLFCSHDCAKTFEKQLSRS